jgi:hypothetical protein
MVNQPDENFGLEPERVDLLQRKAGELNTRQAAGDPEAERTLKQLEVLAALAEKDLRGEKEQ